MGLAKVEGFMWRCHREDQNTMKDTAPFGRYLVHNWLYSSWKWINQFVNCLYKVKGVCELLLSFFSRILEAATPHLLSVLIVIFCVRSKGLCLLWSGFVSLSHFSGSVSNTDTLNTVHAWQPVLWRRPKWTWQSEFVELNAIFSLESEQFAGKQINQK